MIIDGTNLEMIRGDTETITIEIDDETLKFIDGDVIHFTIKKSPYETVKVLQKIVTSFSDGVATISIAPQDTAELKFGSYWYDIQVTFSNGTVKTLVPPSTFKILTEVTYD